jgi:broad specificity phosphatase PhoE
VAVLILVRHGRTEANATALLQGRLDLPLDDVGLRQAREVARAIGPVDRVISSPLLRATQTAEPFGAATTVDDRWLELDYGAYDGMPLAEVPADSWVRWRTDPDFATPGGESMGELNVRVRAACTDAYELAREQTVVVVSHVSPIKAAVAWAVGGDLAMSFRLFLDQAAVCRITVGRDGPILSSFNEVLYERAAPIR